MRLGQAPLGRLRPSYSSARFGGIAGNSEPTRSPASSTPHSHFQRRSHDLHAMRSEDALSFTGRGRPSQPADFQKEILQRAGRLVGNQQPAPPVPDMSVRVRNIPWREKRRVLARYLPVNRALGANRNTQPPAPICFARSCAGKPRSQPSLPSPLFRLHTMRIHAVLPQSESDQNQRSTRSARSVFQLLALPTSLSISTGMRSA